MSRITRVHHYLNETIVQLEVNNGIHYLFSIQKLLNFDGDIWVTERTKSDLIWAVKYEDNHKFERFS